MSFMLIEVEPRKGTRRTVAPETTIGRELCDILLEDGEVSRRHAACRASGEGLAIEDLGSRNGTFVNGERVEGARALADGDIVQIGKTSWRFQASAKGETTFGQAPIVSKPPAAPEPDAAAAPRARERSGDVPPLEAVRSAVHRAPAPRASAPPSFPGPARHRRPRGSAARRGGAVLASYAVVIVTAAAVIAYFVAR